jgi:hypothetical protein
MDPSANNLSSMMAMNARSTFSDAPSKMILKLFLLGIFCDFVHDVRNDHCRNEQRENHQESGTQESPRFFGPQFLSQEVVIVVDVIVFCTVVIFTRCCYNSILDWIPFFYQYCRRS